MALYLLPFVVGQEKSDMDMASSDEFVFILGASSLPIRLLKP